jgi:hypothetical protein
MVRAVPFEPLHPAADADVEPVAGRPRQVAVVADDDLDARERVRLAFAQRVAEQPPAGGGGAQLDDVVAPAVARLDAADRDPSRVGRAVGDAQCSRCGGRVK